MNKKVKKSPKATQKKDLSKSHKQNKSFLNIYSDEEMQNMLKKNNFPAYRSDQIFQWIYSKFTSNIDEMKNIPSELRDKLKEYYRADELKIEELETSGDGTKKILIGLADGESIESVIIREGNRVTFCLSSQVGCSMRCKFCASGKNGLTRNLKAGEIIEQLLLCCREAGQKPDNIVFMGIGEPLMNINNLIKALNNIIDPKRFAMAQRRITISTSGWTRGIKQLAELKKQFNLAFSLHACDDRGRAKLIPAKHRRPLLEILDACDYYREKCGRMITFEYTLIDGVNTLPKHAENLAKLAKEHKAKINLIPFNIIDDCDYETPSRETIRYFLHILDIHGVQATCRMKKGGSVDAACGQLKARVKQENPVIEKNKSNVDKK